MDPNNGLSNGTYPAACEITAGAEGSSDATTTVDVIVDRTIGDFQLPGSDGSGITVTIDDDNTPTVTRMLSIARGDAFGDTTVDLSVTCVPFDDISGSVNPTSTSGDSTELDVTAVEGLDNGTYENACEVVGTATHNSATVTSSTLVTVEVARTVEGIDFGPTGTLEFEIGNSGSDTQPITIDRTNGFTGDVHVTGSCGDEPGITFDPVTIEDGDTTAQVTAHAERGVDNDTAGYTCELTGSGDLSKDATLDATVEVDRTYDEFGLPEPGDVTIYVGNDGEGSGTLEIERDGIVGDTELDLSVSACDAGIALTFENGSTNATTRAMPP
ncbi:MAG: hypothetical protein U5K81_02030 [Trueperaceae bacterium]|nr:hypothetical protein [Trueperaceae bacterium]